MKYLILFSISISFAVYVVAQKLPIDSSAIRSWPLLKDPAISNNGKFVFYTIFNQPVGRSTLVVQATEGSWKKELLDVSGSIFSGDNKRLIYLKRDTLFFLRLGTDWCDSIFDVNSFKWPRSGRGEWVAYQLNSSRNELILLNLFTKKEQRFANVSDYSFDNNGNTLVLQTKLRQSDFITDILQWKSLHDNNLVTIWSAENHSIEGIAIQGYNFDTNGTQLAFTVQEKKDNSLINTIWYYKSNMDKAIMLVNDQTPGIEVGLSIDNYVPQFSKSGNYIFFQLLQRVEDRKANPDAVNVDVWSYKDEVLQSKQLQLLKDQEAIKFAASINVQTNRVIKLEHEGEKVLTEPDEVNSDFVIMVDHRSVTEYWWNLSLQPSVYLLSLKDGFKKKLPKKENLTYTVFSFSPIGKYLVYFDGTQRNYFSYDLLTNKICNITKAIPVRLDAEYEISINSSIPIGVGVAGWMEQDTALLVYDNYDIWKVDPTGNKPPVNITNGYGRLHHIKFSLTYESESLCGLQGNTPLLLTAFNTVNKYNGFYQQLIGKKSNPELLFMGPFILYQIPNKFNMVNGMKPLKAYNDNKWIVQRMSAKEAPNYYLTEDFKSFIPLSDLQPQKKCNWLTAELVEWKQLDGATSQGILYKPENFDMLKKYPLIFTYYEDEAYKLYEFPRPRFFNGPINIPWFVSHGYIVFEPDIHFSIANITGKTNGEKTYNAVISAAKYLSKNPWVDVNRMGIQGFSFGGFETNYLVTHTSMFAAAAEGDGVSDYISSYGSLTGSGEGRQTGAEIGQGRIGATLWERPDLYIKNSPIFKANQVTTPVLIVHNKADGGVPWGQGLELFLALRRLGKKVWMLQYDQGDHGVLLQRDILDYSLRVTQFFDHYLKGAPAPKWMTEGIPARLKGIETKYELDTSGKKP